MFQRLTCCAVIALSFAAAANAVPPVALYLESPLADQNVMPGDPVAWSLSLTLADDENQGLALIFADLVQDPGNPASFDLPPGDPASIPVEMAVFDRPAGITNPGENTLPSGYVGVQRGDEGAKNLVQIGGSQNTFGVALPTGVGLAENANVVADIGHGAPQMIVSGEFNAPDASGLYTFRVENALASVITQRNDPPEFSRVSLEQVSVANGDFRIIVCMADLDGDGAVGLGDLAHLLGSYGQTGMTYADGDLDLDGDIDLSDLATLLGYYGDICGE